MNIINRIKAGIIITGLFLMGCQNNSAPKETLPNSEAPIKEEKITFDCLSDTEVPLGYINVNWQYVNPPFGIEFTFPKGWNAVEDVKLNLPAVVPVGGDLSEFRSQYLTQHYLKLSFMKGGAWNEKRYLFGITNHPPLNPAEESQLDLYSYKFLTAHVFYGNEFENEESLYKKVIRELKIDWSKAGDDGQLNANKESLNRVTKLQVNGTNFYLHNIHYPTPDGLAHTTTLVKKIGCMFLVIDFIWHNESEKHEMLKVLDGLKITDIAAGNTVS